MIKRNVFISLVSFLVLFVVGDVCAQGYEFGPNVRVSDYPPGTADCYTPNAGQRGVVVRGDTVYCVWSDDRDGRSNWFAKSIDGGQTFLPNVRVDDGVGDALLPTLAVGNDGTIYVAWTDERPGYSYDQVYFSKSTDGGLTFTPDVVVNDTAGGLKNHPHRYPSMAVDSAGTIYIAFHDGRNGPPREDIYFSKSTDGGLTFTQDVMVNDSLPGNTNWRLCPGLAADNSGNVYVVWRDERYHSCNDIYFSKSTDGGMTFLPDVPASDTDSCLFRMSPSVNIDGRGYIHVMWRKSYANANIFYSRSIDGGITFSPNIRVNDSIHEPGYQGSPSMCVDDSGVVFAVWEEASAVHPDIYFTSSTDNGDTAFIEPNVKVSDVPPDSEMFNPSIAVGDSGKVYVMWSDSRFHDWIFDVYFAAGKFDNGIVEEDPKFEVGDLKLRIYPNPFRDKVNIQYCMGQSAKSIELKVYDISGRLVSNLVTGDICSGALTWDGKDKRGILVPAGVYYIKGVIGKQKVNEKVVLLR